MRWFVATICVALAVSHAARADDWTTFYEESGFTRTPSYDETVEYCQRLADASQWVHYTTFGTSPQGRPLPLVIVDRNSNFDARSVRETDNVVFLIQAGIHSGEIDGKDAGLMLIRDIAVRRDLDHLLDHVTILFMPIFSVDGHERSGLYNRINQNGPEEMGWRVTANNLNLNRDYLKADTAEMQAWLRLYREWLPEFFADCHVTDGADYQYVITYALELFGNMDEGLTEWTRDRYLAPLKNKMEKSRFPIIRYNSYRTRHVPASGINSWAAPPRFSEGYTAIQNRPGLLIETHMLKPYRARVTGTYEMLRHTLEVLGDEHKALRKLCAEADARAASPGFRNRRLPLAFKSGPDSVIIDFLGYKGTVEESDITGGEWHRWDDKPVTMKIPYFNTQVDTADARLPEAYIVPPEWGDVIDRIALHGVVFNRLTAPVDIEIDTYTFQNVKWQSLPYEGRHPLTYVTASMTETRRFPAGSIVIDMNQRASRVAAHILEPNAPDSFLRWGFFDAVFEQKEYAESYVMEEVARDMLKNDPSLHTEFTEWKKQNVEAAADPDRVRNWFYRRSPWWDDRMGIYPVGRIFDRATVTRILH